MKKRPTETERRRKTIDGIAYVIDIHKKDKTFKISPAIPSDKDKSKFCGHSFPFNNVMKIIETKKKFYSCQECQKIGQSYSEEQPRKKEPEPRQAPKWLSLVNNKENFLNIVARNVHLVELELLLKEIQRTDENIFHMILGYIYPYQIGTSQVNEDWSELVKRLPIYDKWNMLKDQVERFTFLEDTKDPEVLKSEERKMIDTFWDPKMNNEFRWNCIFFFLTSQYSISKERRYTALWASKGTVRNLPTKFKPGSQYKNVSTKEDVIVIQYVPDLRYPKLSKEASLVSNFDQKFQSPFAKYDGRHRKNAEYMSFVGNNRPDLLLEFVRLKNIINEKGDIVKHPLTSTIVDWHYCQRVEFKDLFNYFYDGFTGKAYTYYEIAYNLIIFLSDIILTEDYEFDESKTMYESDKKIYEFLKDHPARTRTLTDFLNSGMSVCKIIHFILHYAKQDMNGVAIIESLYWFSKSIVKQGYYSMNKIYPKDTQIHQRQNDLLPADYKFRLTGVDDIQKFIEILFDQRKAVQINGLYLYLQNCDQSIKRLSGLNYYVWKLLSVEEIRPE